MPSVRHPRATYVAAFILGALLALIVATPARSAEPFRLDRIGVVRFIDIGDNLLRRHFGVLDLEGRTTWQAGTDISRPGNVPNTLLGRPLVSSAAWAAFGHLAPRALENFELVDAPNFTAIGSEFYAVVRPSPLAAIASGRLINLSTRARIGAGTSDEVVAGFVIEERPRIILVRAVGPSLARFGVTDAAPDPFLSVKRHGQTYYFNDNWSSHPEADEVRAVAASVGAFPLDEGSRDAARLVALPPGAYTVHVEAASATTPGGQVLVEIYSVPDEVIITYGGIAAGQTAQ